MVFYKTIEQFMDYGNMKHKRNVWELYVKLEQ